MAQQLSSTNAWVKGKLGAGQEYYLNKEPKEPASPLEVTSPGEGEIARFQQAIGGGVLTVQSNAEVAAIQAFFRTGASNPATLTQGTLTLNKDGGNVAIGAESSEIKVQGKLQVDGDIALHAKPSGTARSLPVGGTMMWNDKDWLRLNQNLDYSKPIFGVHTPGIFNSSSLTVGGDVAHPEYWVDPGPGNLRTAGNVGIGTAAPKNKLDVKGAAVIGATYAENNIAPSNGLLIEGNVGIGTAIPQQKLHVAGSFIRVDGSKDEQGYIGGDGGGDDVQVGSFNPDISLVSLWNAGNASYMNLVVNDLKVTGKLSAALPSDSVGVNELADSSVTEPKLANGVVTTAKLADNLSVNGSFGVGAASPATVGLEVRANGGGINGNSLFFWGSGNHTDNLPYSRLVESWGMRFASPDNHWVLSSGPSVLVGYQPDGQDWGAGNLLVSGNVGIGIERPQASLHVRGNGGILNLEGTDHTYIQWYPLGFDKGRKAWMGYGSSGTDAFTIQNDAGRMHIYGTELLYLLNNNGVIVSKARGGNGTLAVEGDLTVADTFYIKSVDSDHVARLINRAQNDFRIVLGENYYGTRSPYEFSVGHSNRYPGMTSDHQKVFTVNQQGNVRFEGTLQQMSSAALKQDISLLSPTQAFAVLTALSPVIFRRKQSSDDKLHAGFIAEEVPELVASKDRKSYSPVDIVAVLTKVVQHQQEQMQALRSYLEQLELRIGKG